MSQFILSGYQFILPVFNSFYQCMCSLYQQSSCSISASIFSTTSQLTPSSISQLILLVHFLSNQFTHSMRISTSPTITLLILLVSPLPLPFVNSFYFTHFFYYQPTQSFTSFNCSTFIQLILLVYSLSTTGQLFPLGYPIALP